MVSLRARLFALGLLVYFFYQYLCYALGWAFGPLFPLFIVIFAASLAGALWIASTIDVAGLPAQLSKHFPRRGMAILCAFMAVVLLAMWGQRIAAGLRGDLETAMLLGQTTMVVQVLDLGLLVPLSLFTALAAWRGWPVGYLLSSVFVDQGSRHGCGHLRDASVGMGHRGHAGGCPIAHLRHGRRRGILARRPDVPQVVLVLRQSALTAILSMLDRQAPAQAGTHSVSCGAPPSL